MSKMLTHNLLSAAFVFVLIVASVPAGAQSAEPNTLAPEEIADGWILLFDGATLFGWQAATAADWRVVDGTVTVSSGQPGLLASTSDFGDYQLQLDFKTPKGTNSGVFLRTPAVPTDPAKDCYELNIADPDTSPFFTGSFVGRQKGTEYPQSDEWQSFDVTAEGGHFVIKVDGRQLLDYTDPQPLGRGKIGLQFNVGAVAFRNIKLKPLGLAPIFNGRDLTGWKVFPGMKSVFAVTPAGHLNVKNGRGQLETEKQWGDFILQLDVYSNGKSLNSGIFFRNLPGELSKGYESQIHNGFHEGDRSRPVDYGTGAIYNRQKARRVVADDFAWFTKTLVVSGNHMAIWVNGHQVSDFADDRPPGNNAREGQWLKPGTLAIQGHDPTTDLSFRNLRIAEMPAR